MNGVGVGQRLKGQMWPTFRYEGIRPLLLLPCTEDINIGPVTRVELCI